MRFERDRSLDPPPPALWAQTAAERLRSAHATNTIEHAPRLSERSRRLLLCTMQCEPELLSPRGTGRESVACVWPEIPALASNGPGEVYQDYPR